MSQFWTALIGLFGVIIGGFLTYIINYTQFNRDKKLKQEQIIQQKLEQICEIAEEINRSYSILMGEAIAFVKFGRKMEMKINPIQLDKLKMLIYFYAPSLKELYNNLFEAASVHAEGIAFILNPSVNDKNTLLELIIKLNQGMTNQCTALVESSANILRNNFDEKPGYIKKLINNIYQNIIKKECR
jgi:hypothetical protein